MAILVKGDRIETVGTQKTLPRPEGAQELDLSNRAVVPGLIDRHDHLTFLVDADWKWRGMTPMEVIVAATRSAADLLGRSKDLGTLEPGKYADLVAVDGDPTKDVAILGTPAAVVQGGRVIDLGK